MTCLAPLLTNGLAPTLPAGLAQTQTMRNAAVGFQLAVKQKAIMLLDGPPGTGKTTTAAYLIGQAIDEGAPTVYVAIPERPSPTELLRVLIEAISGTPGQGSKHDMENEARALLQDQGGLIVVDEVQNLRRAGLQELRYLHDDSQTNVAMLICGWQADQVIREQPDLNSRVRFRTGFQPLRRDEVVDVVQQIEPRLAATDADVLLWIDDVYAHGVLRNWNSLATTARDLLPDGQGLTGQTAQGLVAVLDSQALTSAKEAV
ncbi:MAG: ATP-binding protein [Candidatus Nanopelagicales bacterium]|nr:ATP-binding protein [Candidatus Nanopelagicales bacterium]